MPALCFFLALGLGFSAVLVAQFRPVKNNNSARPSASIKQLRETSGLPSRDGVRPASHRLGCSAAPSLAGSFRARYGISRASVSSAIMKARSAKASSSALIHAKWIIRSATFQ
jgi:hypothetical protein